jgi:hypothetical protein
VGVAVAVSVAVMLGIALDVAVCEGAAVTVGVALARSVAVSARVLVAVADSVGEAAMELPVAVGLAGRTVAEGWPVGAIVAEDVGSGALAAAREVVAVPPDERPASAVPMDGPSAANTSDTNITAFSARWSESRHR